MDRKTKTQLMIVLSCLVVGLIIVVWLLTDHTSSAGKLVVIDPVAKAHAKPATTRIATTRPHQTKFFDFVGNHDLKNVAAMLKDDPKLATVEEQKEGFATPLHFSAFLGDVEIAKLLLENGADMEAVEVAHHGTPLEWATYAGQIEMVKFLLSRGATVNDEDLRVAAVGQKRGAYLTTQPAVYKEISKLLIVKTRYATTMTTTAK